MRKEEVKKSMTCAFGHGLVPDSFVQRVDTVGKKHRRRRGITSWVSPRVQRWEISPFALLALSGIDVSTRFWGSVPVTLAWWWSELSGRRDGGVPRKEWAWSVAQPRSALHLLFLRSGVWSLQSQEKARGGSSSGQSKGWVRTHGAEREKPGPSQQLRLLFATKLIHQGWNCSFLFLNLEEAASRAAGASPVTKSRCS